MLELIFLILQISAGPLLIFFSIRTIIVIYRKFVHTYNCDGILKDKRIEESSYNTDKGLSRIIIRYSLDIELGDGISKTVGVDLSLFDELVIGQKYNFEIISGKLTAYSEIN